VEWQLPETVTVGGVLFAVILLLATVWRSRTDPKLIELMSQFGTRSQNTDTLLHELIEASTNRTAALVTVVAEFKRAQDIIITEFTQLHSHFTTLQTGVLDKIGESMAKVTEDREKLQPTIVDIVDRLDKIQSSIDQLHILAAGFNNRIVEVEKEVGAVKTEITTIAKPPTVEMKKGTDDAPDAAIDPVPAGG
jgi:chromosome segregation ATPase